MDQVHLSDPVMMRLNELHDENTALKEELAILAGKVDELMKSK